jgi:hypothetical protein
MILRVIFAEILAHEKLEIVALIRWAMPPPSWGCLPGPCSAGQRSERDAAR